MYLARKSLTYLLTGVVLASALPAAPAMAQPSPDPSSLSRSEKARLGELFQGARDAFEADQYGEAIAQLEQAYAILPEPNILFRIAEAHDRKGDVQRARDAYRRYLEAAPKAKDRRQVERRIDEIDRLLAAAAADATAARAAGILVLDTTPSGAEVFLDNEGVSRGQTPLRLELEPGPYQIKLIRPGFVEVTRLVKVYEGDASLLFDLKPSTIGVAKTAGEEDDSGPGAWPWILGSAGVLAAGTGAGLLLIDNDYQEKVDAGELAKRREDPWQDWRDDYNASYDPAHYIRTTGWSLLAGGSAAILGAATWLWLTADEEGPNLALAPGVDGVHLVGNW